MNFKKAALMKFYFDHFPQIKKLMNYCSFLSFVWVILKDKVKTAKSQATPDP